MTRAQEFFHGTTAHLKPGDVVAPGKRPVFPNETDTRYSYATSDQDTAWHYAEIAWNARDTGVPRVYQVEPLGRHSKDPQVGVMPGGTTYSRDNFSTDRRSKHGWRVLSEVQMPSHMGDPEDWK